MLISWIEPASRSPFISGKLQEWPRWPEVTTHRVTIAFAPDVTDIVSWQSVGWPTGCQRFLPVTSLARLSQLPADVTILLLLFFGSFSGSFLSAASLGKFRFSWWLLWWVFLSAITHRISSLVIEPGLPVLLRQPRPCYCFWLGKFC